MNATPFLLPRTQTTYATDMLELSPPIWRLFPLYSISGRFHPDIHGAILLFVFPPREWHTATLQLGL